MSPEQIEQLERDSKARQAERTSGTFPRAEGESYDDVIEARRAVPKVIADFWAWLAVEPQGQFEAWYAARSR